MRAVGERQLHRLRNDVDELRRLRPKLLEVEVLENIQDLPDMDPSRTWRREPNDLAAAVGGANRLAQLELVVLEIHGRYKPAIGFHPFRGGRRELAFVEPGRAL